MLKEGSKRYRPSQLKDPHLVISLLQKRVNFLTMSRVQKKTTRSETFLCEVESLRNKQQQLLRVPFLEEVDPEQQREECKEVLEEAQAAAGRIANMICRV